MQAWWKWISIALALALGLFTLLTIRYRGLPVAWLDAPSSESSPIEHAKAALLRFTGKRHVLYYDTGIKRLVVVERWNTSEGQERTVRR